MLTREELKEVAKVIAAKMADADFQVNKPMNKQGHLPLHIAIQAGDDNLVQRLLDAKADVNLLADGKNAIEVAIETNNNIMLDKVLMTDHQPDLNRQLNDREQTLLHIVAEGKHSVTAAHIARLIHAGADVNKVDAFGKTPLHYAVDAQNRIIVDALLDAGANITITDKSGATPLRHDTELPRLHAGPRMKSQATLDYERVAKAFLTDTPIQYDINQNKEITIEIEGKEYNLSKILEHRPDLEHVDLGDLTADENQFALRYIRLLTQYHYNGVKAVPVDDRENMSIYEVKMIPDNAGVLSPLKGEMYIGYDDKGITCAFYGDSKLHQIPWSELAAKFSADI